LIHQLIRVLYDSSCSLPQDEQFYHLAIKEIESFSISSQVHYLLKERGHLVNTPLFFQVRLKEKYTEALYQNLFIKNQTDQILDRFESLHIKAIPIKGVYFAERYFGHIGARGTSDIDLLIIKEDKERAILCVKMLGFELEEEPIPSHFHLSFSKLIPGSPIPLTVEIHWNILKETTSNLKIEELWNESTQLKEYDYIKELSHQHTFYMICLHGWRHNLDSPKYYIDILQLICVLKDRVSYDRILQDASAHKTLKRIVRTLSIVYEVYPMLDQIKELPLKRKSLLRNKNDMTHKRRFTKYWDFVDYQFFSYDSIQHSLREIYQWLLSFAQLIRR
jgi:hypothetical protein